MKELIDKKIKACLFDMDGTLIDSMGLWKEIDKEYFAMYNIPMPEVYPKEIEGLSVVDVAKYTKSHYPFPRSVEEMLDDWNKMAHQHYSSEVEFKKGAKEFLLWCKKNGIKTGIATSNSNYLFDAVSKHLGFDKLIDAYITGEEVHKGKPDPECYLAVARKLNVDPKDCLVLEDLVAGIEAAIAAGMHTCAISDAYSEYQSDKKKELADYYIDDYRHLSD